MPKLTKDTKFREVFDCVTDNGEESATETVIALKEYHDEEPWLRIMAFLYEHGPRGENLGAQFEQYDKNAAIWSRDLLARVEEWDDTIWKVD